MKNHLLLIFTILLFNLAGCATNPVTGERELSLVSESKELSIGQQQYLPARQSQGGDFIIDPELNAYINEVGNKLAAVSDRKLPYEFKILNNSVPNAWALPGGKISINRGLLTELHSEAELAAVLGHEIVHAAAKHAVRQMSQGILLQTGVMATAIGMQGSQYGGLAQLGVGLGAKLISTKYGRDAERESDHYGMIYMSRAGYDPQGAVDLQRTFVKMSAGQQQDWLNGMFASHPPSEERVQNNLRLLASLPKGGEMGVERYKNKTAHLMKVKPAYDAYDKGRKALSDGKYRQAKTFALRAIALEPKESLFYSLSGDVAQKQTQFKVARQQYDKAISLNPNFFYFYLQRGQANQALGFNNQAEADLKKSIQFLPTGNAYYSLGIIAEKKGNTKDAKGYYAKVANGKDKLGIAAYNKLLTLDLSKNPDQYLQIRVGRGSLGTIAAEIANPTPQNIGGLQVLVQYQNTAGQIKTVQRNLKGSVLSGKKRVFNLDIQETLTDQQLQQMKVKISAAQIVR